MHIHAHFSAIVIPVGYYPYPFTFLLLPLSACQNCRPDLKLALTTEANSLLGSYTEECLLEVCDFEVALAEKETVRLWELLKQHGQSAVCAFSHIKPGTSGDLVCATTSTNSFVNAVKTSI